MKKLRISNLWFYFVISSFFIILLTSMIVMYLTFLLISHELIGHGNAPFFPLFMLLLLSLLIGTMASLLVGEKILRPITTLNNGLKEVALGNFDVKIQNNSRVREVQEAADNFNMMVHQLATLETTRNDFIVNVSHEYKTPIAAIEGYATLLSDKELSEEERKEYTDMIIFSTRQLSSLSGNMLNLSKLENQEIIVEKSLFRLDEQLRQSLLLLEPQWSSKDLTLNIDLTKVNFYGNEELTMQIWLNVLGNALKFTEEKGTITISLTEKNNEVHTTISDTGIGMTKETISRIFEKFYQGDLTRSVDGNGLGLPLVKRIVDLSGGTISVDSEVGKGSTFLIRLPHSSTVPT